MSTIGEIPSDLTLLPGQSFRRNASDDGFEAFTPGSSGAHTHPISDVENLQASLNGKASSAHSHSISDVTGLQAAIDAANPFTKLVLAADKPTAANTTPVTLGLSFNYDANSWYAIDYFMLVQPAAATTGCGFLIDTSNAITYTGSQLSHALAASGTLSGSVSVGDAGATVNGISSGMPGTAIYPVVGSGILISGANAGTATFFFRSETTAVTTCKAGSMIRIMKIA